MTCSGQHKVQYRQPGLQADTPRSRLQGIALVSAAYLCFAVLISCAKWLGQQLPVVEVVWIRMAVHVLISAIVLWPQIGSGLVRTTRPGWQLGRALMMIVMTLCNFTAVQFIALDVNSAILFLTPLLVAMFGAWLLGERLDTGRWLAIATGFVGVLVILRPGSDSFHFAMLLTLMAAVLYALFNLLTRQLAAHDSPSATQFLSTLGGVVILAPFAWWQWHWPTSLQAWLVILVLGSAGAAGHWCLATAHRYAPASTITPFMYMQIVYVMIIGFIVFGDVPDPAVYVGTAIVIGSGWYLLNRERRSSPPARNQRD